MASPSNLLVRVITAAIGAPAIIALLYMGPAWGWFALLLAAAAIGSIELFGMTHPEDRVAQRFGTALTVVTITLLWMFAADARALLTLLFAIPMVAMFSVLLRLGDMRTAALRMMAMAFGPFYLGVGFGATALLRRDAGADGPAYVVFALMLAWLSDTGGYFAGRWLGKHKLYEAVSPKKTIEGSIGGLVATSLGAILAHAFFLKSLPLSDGIALALVAGALGQAGDLGESVLKRSFGVKDSGGILPGHGGILDRVDAVLVTAPITYAYVMWVRG